MTCEACPFAGCQGCEWQGGAILSPLGGRGALGSVPATHSANAAQNGAERATGAK